MPAGRVRPLARRSRRRRSRRRDARQGASSRASARSATSRRRSTRRTSSATRRSATPSTAARARRRTAAARCPPSGAGWSDARARRAGRVPSRQFAPQESERWRLGPSRRLPAPVDRGRVASWVVTTDHKRIGILYIVTSLALLRRGRRPRAADPHAADPGEHRPHRPGRLQPAGHDARDDDGLPRHRPGLGRLRELPRPADDRRPRHGLPAAERALVLALPLRRDRALLELVRRRRRAERRLDELPAALGPDSQGDGPGPLDPLAAHPHGLVARGRDQLHRHDPQHAHGRDDVDAHAAVRLDDRGLRLAAGRRAAGALGRTDAAAARPAVRDELLRPGRGRQTRSSTSTSSGSSGTPRSTS